jgi:hypothetical protein
MSAINSASGIGMSINGMSPPRRVIARFRLTGANQCLVIYELSRAVQV